MLRVPFTRFCLQIHQSARIGVRGGGGQANLGNARIVKALSSATPPLPDDYCVTKSLIQVPVLDLIEYHHFKLDNVNRLSILAHLLCYSVSTSLKILHFVSVGAKLRSVLNQQLFANPNVIIAR